MSVLKIRRNRSLCLIFDLLFTLASLEGINIFLLASLGLSNTPLPWSFIQVLQFGFIWPTIVAFIVIITPILAMIYWVKGGVKRAISQTILLIWLSIVILSWLGMFSFIAWDEIDITPYPWTMVSLLMQFPFGSEHFNHLTISLLGSFSLLLIALILKCFSAKTKAERIFGKAHFSTPLEINNAGLYSDQGLVIGKVFGKTLRLPGFESVLVVAPTGSGKTTAIAVPNLLEWQGSGVFNDIKGELYKLTGRYREKKLNNRCFVWAPADVNKNTAQYNPFYYVSKNPELRIRDLQLIAETLIPASRLGDGFWYQSSREIFLTLSLYLFEVEGMATLAQVHDLSKQENFFEWLMSEVHSNEDKFSKYLLQNAYAILGADEKTQKNILKDFHSRMQLFSDPIVNYATSSNDFDLRELRRTKMSIYINIPDSDKERLSPILTLFWVQLINAMSSHEPGSDEPNGVLALMDEFGNMARINKLKDGMSFLRGYKMRCIIIVQQLSQIISIYGRYDAKGFLNSKVKIAFALNDIDDAKFFSLPLGMKTVRVSSSSISSGHGDRAGSRSESISYQPRALMSPDEIMQLSDKKSIILIEAKPPIKANKCYWFKSVKYLEILNQKILDTDFK